VLAPLLYSLLILAAPDLPEIQLPAGTEVRLDGQVDEAEWADASAVSGDHPLGGRVTLRLKRNGPWLALALSCDQAYRGEVCRLYASDASGAWVDTLVLGVGQPHMPPALWRRVTPAAMQDPKLGPGECPRACRVRLDVTKDDHWGAEYLIRLGALGIGRNDPTDLRLFVTLGILDPEPRDVLSLPAAAKADDPASFARVVSPDHWGAGETWAPVAPEISREFDDNALLYTLFLEHDNVTQDEEAPVVLLISNAVAPRSRERIDGLRRRLEAGRERNPTLPAWTYYLGRLLHEANLYEEAGKVIASVPKPLRGIDAFASLAAEHYLDTGRFQEALDVLAAHPRTRAAPQITAQAELGKRLEPVEQEAIARDAAKKEPNPRVRFVTARGDIVCELFEDDAPLAVSNFIDLVENRHYYDGMRFHYVAGGQQAIVGDPRTRPDSTETAEGPPWRLRPDPSPRPLFAGYLSAMPLEGGVCHGSAIVFAISPQLGLQKPIVFGRIVEGMDVLEALEQDDSLDRVEIISKRNHPYAPQAARVSR